MLHMDAFRENVEVSIVSADYVWASRGFRWRDTSVAFVRTRPSFRVLNSLTRELRVFVLRFYSVSYLRLCYFRSLSSRRESHSRQAGMSVHRERIEEYRRLNWRHNPSRLWMGAVVDCKKMSHYLFLRLRFHKYHHWHHSYLRSRCRHCSRIRHIDLIVRWDEWMTETENVPLLQLPST